MTRLVVGIAVLAMLFGACGGDAGTGASQDDSPEVVKPKVAPGSTPEDTFSALKQAFVDRDWIAVEELKPPSAQAAAELAHQEGMDDAYAEGIAPMLGVDPEQVLKMTYQEFSAAMFGQWAEKNAEEFASMQTSELISVKIQGDRATLHLKAGGEEQDIEFCKENGLWYWGRSQ